MNTTQRNILKAIAKAEPVANSETIMAELRGRTEREMSGGWLGIELDHLIKTGMVAPYVNDYRMRCTLTPAGREAIKEPT